MTNVGESGPPVISYLNGATPPFVRPSKYVGPEMFTTAGVFSVIRTTSAESSMKLGPWLVMLITTSTVSVSRPVLESVIVIVK